jgi:3D (Asp-Asp-Asp) domain-containing protein
VVGGVLRPWRGGAPQHRACSPGGGPLPGDFSGPGSLGGVGGTGVSRPLVEQVRSGSPYAGSRITPGRYGTTAYGPPWGGMQGAGIATSGGLPIRGGAPRWYMIAVSPSLISHGTFVYIWPNPFGWKGPFLAADTGGAIVGNRIDFYDWRGRASQLRWGLRDAEVSASPVAATGGGAPDQFATQPVAAGPGSVECRGALDGSLALPGAKGKVTVAPGADRPGVPTKQPVLDFLARVAGVAGRPLVVTTGSNHSQYTSSGYVSDHWLGMAADLGSVANGFEINGEGGTRIAAAALVAAGIPQSEAWRLASAGGGHDVCFQGWRSQAIWRTGDHWDHVHLGLRRGCSFEGVHTFKI